MLSDKLKSFLLSTLVFVLGSVTAGTLAHFKVPAEFHAMVLGIISLALLHLRKPGDISPVQAHEDRLASYETGHTDGYIAGSKRPPSLIDDERGSTNVRALPLIAIVCALLFAACGLLKQSPAETVVEAEAWKEDACSFHCASRGSQPPSEARDVADAVCKCVVKAP